MIKINEHIYLKRGAKVATQGIQNKYNLDFHKKKNERKAKRNRIGFEKLDKDKKKDFT